MYRQGKAWQHSTYVRRDRIEVMRFARRQAEKEGKSFSRFLTDITYDFLIGKLRYEKRIGK